MIFKDSRLDKKLSAEGYVVLDLLDKQEANELKEFFDKHYSVELKGFHSTHFLADRPLKQQVHEKIVKVMEAKLQSYLPKYKALFGNFMVKGVGEQSRMPLHADWTYVDEKSLISLGVWCPLVDTNEANGMLGVVPRSHRLRMNLRGPQIPVAFPNHFDYIIDNYGRFVPMRVGQVLVYDHRLLHYSNANRSEAIRPAINLVMVPVNENIYHYTNLGNYPSIRKYKAESSDFFIHYEHFQEPDSQCFVEELNGEVQAYTQEHIDEVLQTTWLENIKRKLGFA